MEDGFNNHHHHQRQQQRERSINIISTTSKVFATQHTHHLPLTNRFVAINLFCLYYYKNGDLLHFPLHLLHPTTRMFFWIYGNCTNMDTLSLACSSFDLSHNHSIRLTIRKSVFLLLSGEELKLLPFSSSQAGEKGWSSVIIMPSRTRSGYALRLL